ncbi:ABC transporter permease [Nocardia sp. NPDC055049]
MITIRHLLRSLISLVASTLILLAVWHLLITALEVSPYIAKGPSDVWHYLFTDTKYGSAADRRATMSNLLAVTVGDAGIGFVAGVTASILLAVTFQLLPAAEAMFLPMAMLLRTVPLVGFAPVIFTILGSGTPAVGLIGLILVFFPILINLSLGFRSAAPSSFDLVRVYGGSRWTALWMVAFPSALPNLFAAVKTAVPAAVVGAMLYEWLFSLTGLGGQISVANANSRYDETWTIAVVVTAVSLLAYHVVEFIEAPVLAAWGASGGQASRPVGRR